MSQNQYDHFSDEHIIAAIRHGDAAAMSYILDKYKNMVRKKARGLYLMGGESEDLIQEGMIGLFEAIQNYNSKKDASFYTFARLCVGRQMYTAVKAAARKKHSPLNGYIPLDYETDTMDDENGSNTLSDILTTDISAEDLFVDRENTVWIENKMMDILSPFEKKVLQLYLEGVSYAQIAHTLGKSQKSVDNALQRIKNKTKNLIEPV